MKRRENFMFIEKDNDIYTVSLTPELQEDVGAVGLVEFTNEEEIKEGDTILNLEAAKTILELESPLSGKVIDRNLALNQDPSLLNSDKAEENWVVKLTDVDETVFNNLEEA